MDGRKLELFLAALRRRPVVAYACEAALVSRTDAYRTRRENPEVAKAWDDALEDGIDRAEAEAFRRGSEGFNEPVIHQGQVAVLTEPVLDDEGNVQLNEKGQMRMRPVLDDKGNTIPLSVKKFSDTLLIAVLKARRAAYRVERTELTNPDGSLTPQDDTARAARLAAILEAAERRAQAADNEPGAEFA
jgi:hypothetical protein